MKFVETVAAAGALISCASAAAVSTVSKPFFMVVESDAFEFNGCLVPAKSGSTYFGAVVECGPAPTKTYTYDSKTSLIHFSGYECLNPQCSSASSSTVAATLAVCSQDARIRFDTNSQTGTTFAFGSNSEGGFSQKKSGRGFYACQTGSGENVATYVYAQEHETVPKACKKATLLQGCYNTDPGCTF